MPGTAGTPGHPREPGGARPPAFKKKADLKPHLNRYWLTAKPDPDFDATCADICAVYQAAAIAAEQGRQTVSSDEMTGMAPRRTASSSS